MNTGGQGFTLSGDLAYVDGADQVRLPGWVTWLIDLGRWVATAGDSERLVRVAISVPHRRFAAVFAALGVASGAYRPGVPSDAGERLRFFSSVEPGTPVRYRRGDSANAFECARFLAVDHSVGMHVIKLSTRKLDYSREVSRFPYIQPLPPGINPPARSRPICQSPDFVRSATGLDPIEHGFPSRLECVMIGTKTLLEDELGVGLASSGYEGGLQDLLRCTGLLNPADGYRSRLLSASSDPDPDMIGYPEGAVILDGPSAVVRHRHAAYGRPWVAVIDRTSRRAMDARDALLADRASSLEDVVVPIGAPPPGIEALSFADDRP